MAKELPYFKFEPNQWENGNIQMFSREDKGLFIDLCSMYWSRLGDVPLKLAIQKLCAGNANAFYSLIKEGIFTIEKDFVCIDFLNEQLSGFEDTSKQNSKNAKERWEKHRKQKDECERNASASIPQCENDAIREEKRREDKTTTYKEIISVDDAEILCLSNKDWLSEVERIYKIPTSLIPTALSDFKSHLVTTGKNNDKSLTDFKQHFTNWVRIKKAFKQKEEVNKNKDRL
jgi:hypothetical protein